MAISLLPLHRLHLKNTLKKLVESNRNYKYKRSMKKTFTSTFLHRRIDWLTFADQRCGKTTRVFPCAWKTSRKLTVNFLRDQKRSVEFSQSRKTSENVRLIFGTTPFLCLVSIEQYKTIMCDVDCVSGLSIYFSFRNIQRFSFEWIKKV